MHYFRIFPVLFLLVLIIAVPLTAQAGEPPPGHAAYTLALNNCDDFRSYAEIENTLHRIADEYAEIARVELLGTSVQGKNITGIVISDNVDTEEDEPEVRILGTIHGNECLASEISMRFLELLVEGYGSNEWAGWYVDTAETWIIPLANPDGYSSKPASRRNANNVDLNRNFGFQWTKSVFDGSGGAPFSQPETQVLWANGLDNTFTMGFSYHTVANYVNAVWNFTPVYPRDAPEIESIGMDYKGTSSYNFAFGWHWYPIYGDITDWAYGTFGTLDYTIEAQSDTDVEGQWETHRDGLVAALSWIDRGIRGIVQDAETGDPVSARILVTQAAQPVYTDPQVGDYHKILVPGTYIVRVDANGYEGVTRKNVKVGEDNATRLDFDLKRSGKKIAYANQVFLSGLPAEIRSEDYANETLPSDALGEPDGEGYSLSPGGWAAYDMGRDYVIRNGNGADLLVESYSDSSDPCEVYLWDDEGGWVPAAKGTGDIEVDLSSVSLESSRYVMIVDKGSGPMNEAEAGYDLDAIVNYHPVEDEADGGIPEIPDAGADADVDGDTDSDADTDAGGGVSGDLDDEDLTYGGCGCRIVNKGSGGLRWMGLMYILGV